MSTTTIRNAAVTVLEAVSGVENVEKEQPFSLNASGAEAVRRDGPRAHWWTVSVQPEAPRHYLGTLELQRRVRIEGFLGVAREEPSDGTPSDETAKTLLDTVLAAFADKDNRTLGGVVLDGWDYVPEQVVTVVRNVGRESVPVHRMALSFMTAEDG